MSKRFNYLIFIGRFQPYHAGHHDVMKRALDLSENVIMALGGHDRPPEARNPFSTEDRIKIILSCFTEEEATRIHFLPQYDYTYNDQKWLASIQGGIQSIIHRKWTGDPISIGLIGREKDHTSYYLKMFPEYESVGVGNIIDINATDIRENWFARRWNNAVFYKNKTGAKLDQLIKCDPDLHELWYVNNNHRETIIELTEKPSFLEAAKEFVFLQKYKKQWAVAPYPVIFNTVDAVVVQSGYVLLVERGADPGKGLWALPGGFLNEFERTQAGVIRELREETKLKVPDPVLIGNIKEYKVFDYPYRSQRGRTITHAYYIKLPDATDLPKIKGSDDARKAMWVPLDEVKKNRSKFFEDHYEIIDDMVEL